MALTKQSEDFPAWYQEVVKTAELAENSLVRGTMVIKPYGFALWEAMQASIDRRIKETGHENVYFPLFIPEKLLEKEKDHVEGFSPEVAVVTHAGGEKLEEPLVVRPTSETIIWATYAKWVQSYRDLPLLYNQWCNVVRWELRPRLFLRTTEFLWQEGHTAHETEQEAWDEARKILFDVYRASVEEDFAVPVRAGLKSTSERFPGAQASMTIEALMRDGKALQSGTSHYFGQNFSKAYDVRFQGRDGEMHHPYSTSWGASTRLVGGLVMTHGDDSGLRLPPKVAPKQVVVVPIYPDEESRSSVIEGAAAATKGLEGLRVHIDDREQYRPGHKFNEWELKGVPVRLELGPRELESQQIVVYRRDTGEKETVGITTLERLVPELLDEIQDNLYRQAVDFRDEHTFRPENRDEFLDLARQARGLIETLWCGDETCEAEVKGSTKATNRLLEMDPEEIDGVCLICGREATERAVWAQAY